MNELIFNKIKLLVLDVDGIMTDGSVIMSETGEVFRSFSVYDGFAIINSIKKGLKIAVISGAKSESIVKRCNSLGIELVVTGREDKLQAYNEKIEPYFKIDNQYVAYMGDDVYDMPLMERVAFAITVPNAMDEVKNIADYICKNKGGNGAIREFIDLIFKL